MNIGLLYRLARQLTGSREAGVLAALLGCYHNRMMDLYQNGGVVYDILCYTFFVAAVSCYIAGRGPKRAQAQALTGWRLARFGTLALLAFNSKEMALTLAAALWAYEWVYRAPASWRPAELWKWARSDKAALWMVTAATPLAAWAKTRAGSAFAGVGDYQVHLSGARWLETTRAWMGALLYRPYPSLSVPAAVLVMAVPLILAIVVRDRDRRKPFLLCAAWVWILPLPVNFIAPRNFFVMYLPLVAWSVCAAHALTIARDGVVQKFGRVAAQPVPGGGGVWARLALAAVTLLVLHEAQHRDRAPRFEWIDPSQAHIRAFAAGLAEICPGLPSGGKLEVLDDPFNKSGWEPSFITRLWTRKADIEIHRWPPASSDDAAPRYDCTMAYRDGKFVRPE
jgi:hypothetical protein